MEIKQLKYFVACANHQSFSRAAHQLNVAQSAISRQIQGLEREVGSTLILRNSHNFQLTEAGELFFQRATNVLHELHDLKGGIATYAGSPKGDLRVGVLSFAGELVMPRVIRAYSALYPDVRILLRSGTSNFVEEWLNHDEIDVAVMHSPKDRPGLIIEHISYGEMVVVLPPPSAISDAIDVRTEYEVKDLATLPLILTSAGQTQRTLLEREAHLRGFKPRIILEADNISLIVSLVKSGIGASVLSYTSAHAAAVRGDIQVSRLINPGIRTDISIVTRNDRPVNAAMRAMISQIKNSFREFSSDVSVPDQYFQLAPRWRNANA